MLIFPFSMKNEWETFRGELERSVDQIVKLPIQSALKNQRSPFFFHCSRPYYKATGNELKLFFLHSGLTQIQFGKIAPTQEKDWCAEHHPIQHEPRNCCTMEIYRQRRETGLSLISNNRTKRDKSCIFFYNKLYIIKNVGVF